MKRNVPCFLAAAAATLIGVSSGVRADTQPAMAGHGWPNPIDPCLATSWAQVINTCAANHLLIIPMQVRAPGTYQAFARAAGRGYQNATNCQALAISSRATGWSFSSLVSSSVSADPQLLSLGYISVPAGGTVHFECQLGTNEWFPGSSGQTRVINVELL